MWEENALFSIFQYEHFHTTNPHSLTPCCTSQVAFQQADFTGWNLWAAINDRPLLPFRFCDYSLSYGMSSTSLLLTEISFT
jgi:NADH dehydrogenase FAD-containing subunit